MKLHKEDPRLTAYLLGELPQEEATMVEDAAASDEALRAALRETEHLCGDLKSLLGGEQDRLLPIHRESIRKAAKEAARQGKIEILESHRTSRKIWQVPLAAAAVIGGGIFFLTMVPPTKHGGSKTVTTKADATISENPGIEAVPREGNVMRLPLEAGKRSLSLVTTAIRIEDKMPESSQVRIEELLNAFPLKAKGSAALWKGCTLAAEILPCPWQASGNLILVSVQGARDGDRKLSVELKSASPHRLIGYSTTPGKLSTAPAESTIRSGESVVLMIETNSSALELGSLVWTVDGTEAPAVDLVSNPEMEPSDDASFATLICAFGMWLRGEGKPDIDDLLVLALAREAASESLVADRYDFLTLVDQAMKVSEK